MDGFLHFSAERIMEKRYEDWIAAYKSDHNGFLRGKCEQATSEMAKEFPELRRVCGFVHAVRERAQHFWCITEEGEIVDPTASQFFGIFEYEELDLSNPEDVARIPTGVCMNCGDDVYSHDTFCSDACYSATLRYLNSV